MDETKKTPTEEKTLSRRTFLGASAAAAAGVMVVPRHVIGATQKKKAPSDTLNLACVGVGGMGFSDTRGVRSENIVALCDVDDEMVAKLLRSDEVEPKEKAMYEKAAKYHDWRRLLDKEKGIDALTVTVPDHNHADHRHGGHQAGQACLRPETADPHDQGSPDAGQGGQGGERRHPDGQPGPLQGRRAPDLRVDLGRGDRQRLRSPRLDEPPDLAPGDRRSQGDPVRPARRSIGTSGSDPAPCRPYHPGLPSFRLARLVGLRHRAPSATWAPTSSTSRSGP